MVASRGLTIADTDDVFVGAQVLEVFTHVLRQPEQVSYLPDCQVEERIEVPGYKVVRGIRG